MIKFLARREFNLIDLASLGVIAKLLEMGLFWQAVVFSMAAAVASILAEKY